MSPCGFLPPADLHIDLADQALKVIRYIARRDNAANRVALIHSDGLVG